MNINPQIFSYQQNLKKDNISFCKTWDEIIIDVKKSKTFGKDKNELVEICEGLCSRNPGSRHHYKDEFVSFAENHKPLKNTLKGIITDIINSETTKEARENKISDFFTGIKKKIDEI